MGRDEDPNVSIRRQALVLLRGVFVDALDVDWLAVDGAGELAIFLGEPGAPRPAERARRAASMVLEELPAHDAPTGYRVPSREQGEALFDPPRTADGQAHHEAPFDGYGHLLMVSDEALLLLRRSLAPSSWRGALVASAHEGIHGVIVETTHRQTEALLSMLHERGDCGGCRALDMPGEPRPRSPAHLASGGLYVYEFRWGKKPSRDAWVRAASPTVPLLAHRLPRLESSGWLDGTDELFRDRPRLDATWFAPR